VRRLPWLIAAAMAYEAYAVETGHAPKITALVHLAVRHFLPHCPGCTCATVVTLVPLNEHRYRGWHTEGTS
jgi:hypothetical protein